MSPNPGFGYSPVPKCMVELGTLQSWQTFDPLACGMRAVIVGKAKWKPLELPLPRNIVNQSPLERVQKVVPQLRT